MRQLERFFNFGGEGAHHGSVFPEHLRAHAVGNGFDVFMLFSAV